MGVLLSSGWVFLWPFRDFLSSFFFCSNPDFHDQQARAVPGPSLGAQPRQRKCILQVINMSAPQWRTSIHLSTHLLATGVACGMLRGAPAESTFVH